MSGLKLKHGTEGSSSAPAALALEQLIKASDVVLDILPIGLCIYDRAGHIVQYNRHAVEIWGRAPKLGQTREQFTAASKFFWLDGRPMARSEMPLTTVLEQGTSIRGREMIVELPTGVRRVVSLNIDPLVDGDGNRLGAINCFQDVSERHHTLAALQQSRSDLREHEQRLAATYEHAAIGITEVDANSRLLRVNEAMCAIAGFPRDEMVGITLFERTHPDDAGPDQEAFRRQVSGELGIYSIEKRMIRKDGRTIWISVRSSTVRDSAGHFLYAVRVVQDISERRIAEERQKLFIDELNHRVKNTLATVQSLANQTARGAANTHEFRERFEGRLIALSKAHDQLTERNWQNADLRAILSASIAPYLSGSSEQAVLRGEDVTLKPRAALTLAMVFHELTTNAAKYGALSVPNGCLRISWERQLVPKPLLRITWQEEKGPAVVTPARRGFGTYFIEGSIASELGGKARIAYEKAGLRCVMDIPLASAQPDVPGKAEAHASLVWEDRSPNLSRVSE